MATPPARDAEAACLSALESALGAESPPDLAAFSAATLDAALDALAKRHGASASPLVQSLAERAPAKAVKKAARRALYKMTQAGLAAPTAPRAPGGAVVRPLAERPVRAWLSAIDGTGSRAVWILFEGGLGGQLQLCSLILNDEVGVLEAAGGAITRKRLDAELRVLREHQKLPWVESDPGRACALVGEALALHGRAGTGPPPEFSRWQRFFTPAPPAAAGEGPPASEEDPALIERSVELLERPEFGGWFVDPAQIHEESLALLQLRESRLVVSDQIKSEREAAIVDSVLDKQLADDVRPRWARRLAEMSLIFRDTGRAEAARMAAATAAGFADLARPARHIPFARALAMRGLTMGAEVALGRAKLADVTRAPARTSSS